MPSILVPELFYIEAFIHDGDFPYDEAGKGPGYWAGVAVTGDRKHADRIAAYERELTARIGGRATVYVRESLAECGLLQDVEGTYMERIAHFAHECTPVGRMEDETE